MEKPINHQQKHARTISLSFDSEMKILPAYSRK